MAALPTVIDVVSQASMEIGIAQSEIASVVGSLDQDVVQMLALIDTVADELLGDEPYRTTLGDGIYVFSNAGQPKEKITANDDRLGFERRLVIDGLKYRFLKAKGLEFGEELRDFLSRLNKLAARANSRVLDLDIDQGRVQ